MKLNELFLKEERPAYIVQMSSGRWVISNQKDLNQNAKVPLQVLDDHGTWIPFDALVHADDWQGIAFSSKEKAEKNLNAWREAEE